MGETTGISWTDSTFNPWIGCAKVSPGCTNCYAEGFASRFGMVKWGVGKPRQRTTPANWAKPLAWNKAAAASGKRHLVFCASMADWLDPEVPAEWLADLLELIASTPRLTWQLLTKRPELWQERLQAAAAHENSGPLPCRYGPASTWLAGTPPANVWIGCTVEDQRRADERIPALLSIPARVQFLSMEPLLEPVTIPPTFLQYAGAQQWVIVGGESGHKARPFNLGWARSIVHQCRAVGVAVFVKQMGDDPRDFGEQGDDDCEARLQFTSHHGADPTEWPADLRVQEFPK